MYCAPRFSTRQSKLMVRSHCPLGHIRLMSVARLSVQNLVNRRDVPQVYMNRCVISLYIRNAPQLRHIDIVLYSERIVTAQSIIFWYVNMPSFLPALMHVNTFLCVLYLFSV